MCCSITTSRRRISSSLSILVRLAASLAKRLPSRAGVRYCLGDSEYNRQELEELGFLRTGVLPIAVDTDRLTSAPRHPVLEDILDDGLVNFLFVGRIAPNKKIEDHIRLAEQYKRYVDAYYRFIFVGRYDVVPQYYATIRALISEYKMLEDRFIFTGPVPDVELAAYYRASSAYISLSEHEGFCVPLVEAMAMDVPILAYSRGVPDRWEAQGGVLPRISKRGGTAGMLAFENAAGGGLADSAAGSDFGDVSFAAFCITEWCLASTCELRSSSALRKGNSRRLRIPLPLSRRTHGEAQIGLLTTCARDEIRGQMRNRTVRSVTASQCGLQQRADARIESSTANPIGVFTTRTRATTEWTGSSRGQWCPALCSSFFPGTITRRCVICLHKYAPRCWAADCPERVFSRPAHNEPAIARI